LNYLLHIDTSADVGTVAISADGVLVAERTTDQNREYASLLNGMIDEVLADAKIKMDVLSGVVVCAGPGSYTGLRIGLSTAKGLCYVLDKPLLLDNKLSLLAYREYMRDNKQDKYISILNAREGEFFVAVYDNKFNSLVEPTHIHIAELHEMIDGMQGSGVVTGEIDAAISDFFKIKEHRISINNQVDTAIWAMYAYEQYKCNRIVNLSTAEPFYLKNFYTNKPIKNL
jgi:tRNA threonylcarbamoyladenosine biosynthesis protein TsaB